MAFAPSTTPAANRAAAPAGSWSGSGYTIRKIADLIQIKVRRNSAGTLIA
jgi:hypothetical protein